MNKKERRNLESVWAKESEEHICITQDLFNIFFEWKNLNEFL